MKIVLHGYPFIWLKEIDECIDKRTVSKLFLMKLSYYLKHYAKADIYEESYIEPLRIGFINLLDFYDGDDFKEVANQYKRFFPNKEKYYLMKKRAHGRKIGFQ